MKTFHCSNCFEEVSLTELYEADDLIEDVYAGISQYDKGDLEDLLNDNLKWIDKDCHFDHPPKKTDTATVKILNLCKTCFFKMVKSQ